MQIRAYAGYWFDRDVTSPQPWVSEMIQGFGEVVIDIGDDGIIDPSGALDYLITPKGKSGDLNSVVYRELTLENASGQSWKLDVIHLNSASDIGTLHQKNTGAVVALDGAQFDALPKDIDLKVVSFRDYDNAFVPAEYIMQKGTITDTPGDSFWWNNLTFGTLQMAGNRTDYVLGRDAQNILQLKSAGGIDRAAGFERIAFNDGILAFDTEGNSGQAYRLYQAAFERTPDNEGLKYWIGRLDSGDTTLAAIADSFLKSPEFVRTYGTEETVSNARFVELLYTHTLGREYDQDGYNYWVGKLNAGDTNRRDLLAFFSESNENKAKVADVIDDGIWLPSVNRNVHVVTEAHFKGGNFYELPGLLTNNDTIDFRALGIAGQRLDWFDETVHVKWKENILDHSSYTGNWIEGWMEFRFDRDGSAATTSDQTIVRYNYDTSIEAPNPGWLW